MEKLGADRTALAPIDRWRFRAAKYTMRIKRVFCDVTALDWIVSTGNSAQAPRELIRALRESRVALVHVNHVFPLRFAKRLLRQVAPSSENTPVILETHDIQAHTFEERGHLNPWTRRFDSTQRLVETELSYLEEVKVLVHLSVDDFRFFQKHLPRQKHVLALPTIDESFVSAVRTASNTGACPIDLLFVGQRTGANCAAIEWFYEEVWPLIAEHRYNVKIVGQIEVKVRELLPALYQTHKASFVGSVEELAPYYRAARCVFAPMVSGTGISIKTIEALALGKPFVGTSKAYRGMPMERLVEAGLKAYDTPNEFADAIVNVLSEKNHLADAGRRAYEALFSKQAAYAARDRALSLGIAS
jgi:glycosyltransferase involved in cell wall biosynthesis